MSNWDFQAPDCFKKACFLWGDCFFCGLHFCSSHVENVESHPCVEASSHQKEILVHEHQKRDIKDLMSRIDLNDVAAEAASLRPGHTCTPPLDPIDHGWLDQPDFIAHGTNIHIPLTFDDGVKWMVRIRQRRQISPPPPAALINMMSDAATFRVLHDAGVKVPQSFLRPDHRGDPDLLYFFTEFIPGLPFHPFIVNLFALSLEHPQIPGVLRPQVMLEVAKWYISLEKVTFPLVGSPTFDSDGTITVGPVIEEYVLRGESPFYLGPFGTARERYLTLFATIMKHIVDGVWCAPHMELQTYLEILEVKELVREDKDLLEAKGPWYLKHGDPRGDHFHFAEDAKLTGVLDWEWSFITSKADAFAAPHCFTDNQILNQGVNALGRAERDLAETYDSLGRADLGDYVRGGKKYQRLRRMTRGYTHSVLELNALRRSFLGLPDGLDGEPKSMKEWMQVARERYRGDKGLKELMTRHGSLPTRIKGPGHDMEDVGEVKEAQTPVANIFVQFK